MGNYLNTCNGIKSVSIINSTKNDLPINNKNTTIRLVLVGLDNAGKTSTALHLLKKPIEDVIPTLGFNSYILDSPALNKNKDTKVELIDLGGSIQIRKIWEEYYASAHGLVCLLDSADSNRFKEIKNELEKILSNKNVQGKPFLVLLNKQDLDDAMDEIEICNEINIEQMVNDNKCPTKIEQCAVQNKNKDTSNQKKKKVNLDNGIEQGFNWIVNYILNNWEKLDERVKMESKIEENKNKDKIDALREKYKNKNETDKNETNEEQEKTKENPFKPIDEVVKDLDKKERLKNGLKDDLKNKSNSAKEDASNKKQSKTKLTDKINEVKKKAMVVRQNKVHEVKDKSEKNVSIEKQDSKDNFKDDLKENVKDVQKENAKDIQKDIQKDVQKDDDDKTGNLKSNETDQTNSINQNDKNSNSLQNSTTNTNSTDTTSNETVIEVKK